MRGLRIRGRQAPVRHGRGAAPILALACCLFALTGCLQEETGDARRGDEKVVVFQTTAEQVQRAGKTDPLIALAAAPRMPEPPAAGLAPLPEIDTGEPEPVSEKHHALSHFHAALRALDSGARQKPVTVLHLGDSHIASDRFTGDIREMLQERFGDAGRGLMMPGFPFEYYRARGVKFARTGAWAASNSFREAEGRYGLTGVRMTAHGKGSRLILTSEKGPFEWAEVTFLAGPGHGSALVAVDGSGKSVNTGEGEAGIRRVRIEHKGTKLSVRTLGGGPVSVLSWSVGHNRPGVRYVNLGIPGATADTTRRWDDDLVHDEVAALDPDLIVLGYGTNEGFNDGLDIDGYEKRVTELAGKLRDAAPEASLAIIGPADGARLPRFARGRGPASCKALSEAERRNYASLVKSGNGSLARWHPPPKLAEVRAALERVAAARDGHFWDWSAMMGGACGIHAWTRSDPKLALADHVHISGEGGRRSARAFVQSLLSGYDSAGQMASRSGAFGQSSSLSR